MSISIAEAILEATQVFRRVGVPEARREAGLLLAHAIARDRTFLITHAEDTLRSEELETFRHYVERRAQGEPVQYITGHQEFFGLDFEVSRDVLIPRPETEILVAKARAIAVDISETALSVATRNAARHNVIERITFVTSDCFAALEKKSCFDLVLSNPPYVADKDLSGLQREVREHEPRVALTPGDDGLSVIRCLLVDAAAFLVDGGHLVIEIGFDQRAAVERLIDPGIWNVIDVRQDLQGIPRTIVLQKSTSSVPTPLTSGS